MLSHELFQTEDLHREVKILLQTHERDYDRKDAVLQMLLGDVDECEEELRIAVRHHLTDIDVLVDHQDTRLLALETNFHTQLNAMKAAHKEQRKHMQEAHSERVTQMKHVFSAVAEQEKAKQLDIQSEHEQRREELNSAALERIHYLQSILDSRIEDLEGDFEKAHIAYMQGTDVRMQEYKALMSRGEKLAASMQQKKRRLASMKGQLQQWRSKLLNSKRQETERNAELKNEKEAMRIHLERLKLKLAQSRKIALNQLKQLSSSAIEAKRDLVDNTRLAERLLQLGENARRMEDEAQLIAPFADDGRVELDTKFESLVEVPKSPSDTSSSQIEEHELLQGSLEVQPHEPTMVDIDGAQVIPLKALQRFNTKVNRAALETLQLQDTQAGLELENAQLQDTLHQLMQGLTVTADTLKSDNPLLIVNDRAGLAIPVIPAAKRITVVEGAQLQASARMQAR